MVISLSAKGLTHGEIAAHLAEVYGAEVSRQTISTITDKVMEGMAEWQNRPLDPGRSPRCWPDVRPPGRSLRGTRRSVDGPCRPRGSAKSSVSDSEDGQR